MIIMSIESPGNDTMSNDGRVSGSAVNELYALEYYINAIWKFLPVPIVYLNLRGVILDVSDSFLEMSRYRRDELVGGTLVGLVTDQDRMKKVQELTLERSRVSNHRCVIRNKEGLGVTVDVSTLLRNDEHGSAIGYFVAMFDVSQRIPYEGVSDITEVQYRATLNSLGDGIHVVDRDLRIVMVNDALRTRIGDLGIDVEPVGKSVREVFSFLPPAVETEYSTVFKRGELLLTEETVSVGNREYISEVRKIPIFEGDTVSQVVTVIHDITAQKRDERIRTVLYKISSEVNTNGDLDRLFGFIKDILGTIIDTRNFYIALRAKGEQAVSLVYFVDERDDFKSLPPGKTLTSYVIENNRSLLVTENDARQMLQSGKIEVIETPAKVWLGVPLRLKHDVIGALVVQNYEDSLVYTRKDLEILEFVAERLAAAIERRRVDEEVKKHIQGLKKTSTSIIFTMAKILELRDPYTAGHQQRVARLACAIAREMRLTEEEVDGIFLAALIHDIGKIYVPAEILNRPAKLNETEMDLVRTHPNIGYDIVKEIDFSQPVDRIVVQHHERIDGSGYPNGIDGNDIIMQARILAVADVVEAMASHRPYRPAMSLEATLNEIDRCRDTLYDSNVVDACMKVFRDSKFKFD
jgi:PAS domain S-box-containing protein/putative nucleotidyltransferase with HDIG domain